MQPNGYGGREAPPKKGGLIGKMAEESREVVECDIKCDRIMKDKSYKWKNVL